ncbi:MAG TPA: Rieske 2Fe-2S domain-containing protein [Dehalococcoidia bacterium]|nr:Rieske 2Fe-2S domain-containing protein [Dehalococcoidia bacterium]
MTTIPTSSINYDDLIQESSELGFRISGRLFTDPAIFQEEMEQIFHRGWVFIGHESEVPESGDYRTRMIGRHSVIMARDEDGQVNLLVNRCRHQSATVCQEEAGNSSYFRCAYHGWVYKNSGELVGVPFPEGYDESFQKEGFGLVKVPRLGNHRGFVFGSLSPSGQSFEDYLGRAKDYIDRYCDMSPSGEIMASAGRLKIRYNGNWKFQVQNITDGYHVHITHATAAGQPPASGSAWTRGNKIKPSEDPLSRTRDLGGGHTSLDRSGSLRELGEDVDDYTSGGAGTLDPEVLEAVAKRLGSREQAEWIARGGPPHVMIFPNMMLLFNAFRLIEPVSIDQTNLYFYPVLFKGASDQINSKRLRETMRNYGPSGFIAPDDCDMYNRMQTGYENKTLDWSVLNRGQHIEQMVPDDFGVPTPAAQYTHETSARAIWRHYKRVMSGA